MKLTCGLLYLSLFQHIVSDVFMFFLTWLMSDWLIDCIHCRFGWSKCGCSRPGIFVVWGIHING